MKTRCKNCRKLIEFRTTYCDSCKKIKDKEKDKTIKTKKADSFLKTKTWKAIREKVILRDNGCCQLCIRNNFIEYRNLQVHHIIKRADDESLVYELDNLVTLCRSCHDKIEDLPIAKQREMLGKINEIETYRLL